MENSIKDFIDYSKGGILSKEIARDSINTTLFCMAMGTELSEHTSARDAFVFVIEGKGLFNLDGKDIEMAPGVFISMKKNTPHSLKAHENMSFVLILY